MEGRWENNHLPDLLSPTGMFRYVYFGKSFPGDTVSDVYPFSYFPLTSILSSFPSSQPSQETPP